MWHRIEKIRMEERMDRETLGRKMRKRGVREGLVRRCENIFRETRNKVRVGGEMSNAFWTARRVKQGCPLSPGLFNLLIADVKEHIKRGGWGGVKLMGERIYTLAYADNLVLLLEKEEGMRSIMARLKENLRAKGLTVNVGKSKIMIIK